MNNLKKIIILLVLFSANFIFAQNDIEKVRSTEITKDEIYLKQNYPNPFNPTTNIKYQIANKKLVILKIYDILGKEIETLVNERQSPGVYEVTFDGSALSSGVYFYKLTADNYSETKKLVLIK